MSKVEWFRRSTWTEQDQEEFKTRLHRSRKSSRSQYLRIQAVYLAAAGLHVAAIKLLDQMLTEYPDVIQLSPAHLAKAESLACLGIDGPAIAEYRCAIQSERNFPNVHAFPWLSFGWFTVERNLIDLYGEILALFEEFGNQLEGGLASSLYQYWAVKSIIADSQHDRTNACDYATRAIEVASITHSGLRYHPKLGLVKDQPKWIVAKLKELANRDGSNAPKHPWWRFW